MIPQADTAGCRRPLLTPKEAAALLRVTVSTLAVWRCQGRYSLPFVKVGRSVAYRLEDLEAFIAARTCGIDEPKAA